MIFDIKEENSNNSNNEFKTSDDEIKNNTSLHQISNDFYHNYSKILHQQYNPSLEIAYILIKHLSALILAYQNQTLSSSITFYYPLCLELKSEIFTTLSSICMNVKSSSTLNLNQYKSINIEFEIFIQSHILEIICLHLKQFVLLRLNLDNFHVNKKDILYLRQFIFNKARYNKDKVVNHHFIESKTNSIIDFSIHMKEYMKNIATNIIKQSLEFFCNSMKEKINALLISI